jgi:hypothetical protein
MHHNTTQVSFRKRAGAVLARAVPVVAALLQAGTAQPAANAYGHGSARGSVLAVAKQLGGWEPSDVLQSLQLLQVRTEYRAAYSTAYVVS